MALNILQSLIQAGKVYGKDKIADWTDGTRFEPYTSQWDNPGWDDYAMAGIGGLVSGTDYSKYFKAFKKGKNIYDRFTQEEIEEAESSVAQDYNDDRFYNSSFKYTPDLFTTSQQRPGRMYLNQDQPDNSDTVPSLGSRGNQMFGTKGGIAGSVMDIIFNTNQNSRPADPYWRENG